MKEIEIIDSFKKDLYKALCCIFCFVFFFIWVTVMLFINPTEKMDPNVVPILVLIIWTLIGFSFLCFYGIMKGWSKPRKFKISETEICFSIPNKPTFKIKWLEFDSLHINTVRFSDAPGVYGPSTHFQLNFIKGTSKRVFEFVTNQDFHKKRIIPQIMTNLKQFTLNKDKELRFLTVSKGFATKIFHEIGFSN